MSEFDEIIKPFERIYSGCKNPVAFLDENLVCVKSSGVISPGESIAEFAVRGIHGKLDVFSELKLCKEGGCYCCRMFPIPGRDGDTAAYMCELIGVEGVNSLLEYVNIADYILPFFNTVEQSVMKAAKNIELLRNEFSDGSAKLLDEALSELNTATESCINYCEYLKTMYSGAAEAVIDAAEFCGKLVRRCNQTLMKCGRSIEFFCEPDNYYILADSRQAEAALLNTLQNALLNSPKNCRPVLTVSRVSREFDSFIEIQVICDSKLFTEMDFENIPDGALYRFQSEYGTSLIDKFACTCGGSFSVHTENGREITVLSVPEAFPAEEQLVLNAPGYAEYSTGLPSYAEILMNMVVRYFGSN